MEHNKRSSFSGKLGYVLSAAGASVGLGKYLEISVSGSKVRRRHFPADLYFAGVDLRLYHDCSGNRDWAHDEKSPVGAFSLSANRNGCLQAAGSTRSFLC